MVYVFLADGFEEIEALCPVDIMRRAGIDVKTVSLQPANRATGAHNIKVEADLCMESFKTDSLPELIMLPGGMPGAANLSKDKRLTSFILSAYSSGSMLAAICAAPFILGELGLLRGKRATCFPGFEGSLEGALLSGDSVVRDGKIITAVAMGAATDFGLEIVRALRGAQEAERIADSIHHPFRPCEI